MRPYIAVIRDSFHAALSSRILWVAFIAIWLLLALLAPIGYQEDFTTTFRWHDFEHGTRFKAMLAQGLVDPNKQETAIGRIAAAMPEDLRRQLQRVGEGDEVRIRLDRLSSSLNELLDNESWYESEAWKSALRLRELRELDEFEDGELEESMRRRRARLRIEAAFPGVFETRSARSISVTYAGREFPWGDIAVDKSQFINVINQFVLPLIIDMVLGFALAFLGILVTASIIPDMLQPGSLHLLLSKPVSRPLLLISKFLGGCAFVLLCVVQLILGLYLIAGLRLDIWNVRLLWCIPVSVFLFAVYYSVSMVAGLRWRSSILAIGVTAIFWVLCFVVGIIDGLFQEFITRPAQIKSVAVIEKSIFGATHQGGLVRFDYDTNTWTEIIENKRSDKLLAPIVLDDRTLATAQVRGGRFNPFGSGVLDLLVINAENGWTPEPSLRLPTATSRLYRVGENGVLALNTAELAITDRNSILIAAGQQHDQPIDQQPPPGEQPDENGWLEKLSNMMGGVTSGFTSILPSRTAITSPRQIVIEPGGESLVALTRGRMMRLKRPKDASETTWTIAEQKPLEGDASRRGVMAMSDDMLLVWREDEQVQIFNRENFTLAGTFEFPSSLDPVSAKGLPDSRFAILTSDGECHIIRASEGGSITRTRTLAINDIESIHVRAAEDELYVVHHIDQIDIVNTKTLEDIERIRPSYRNWRWVNKYIVKPIRMLIPQTGKLGETTRSLVSGKSAFTFDTGNNEEEVVRYDVVEPVVSCSIFILIMLTIGGVYFSTRDF